MKYAVNFNQKINAITGWIAGDECTDLHGARATFVSYKGATEFSALDVQRDDVFSAGLHPTGFCGFVFYPENIGVKPGDFFRVAISDGNGAVGGYSSCFGRLDDVLDRFNKYELPRDDFSIMSPPVESLFEGDGDLLGLKKILIRLRRAKRAKGWRGKFVGIEHSSIDGDIAVFRKTLSENIDIVADVLSPRYLWSILDTLADFPEEGEGLAALSVSNLLSHERFSQTLNNIFSMTPLENPLLDRQLIYWGGMGSNRLCLDDAFDIFLTRNIEALRPYKIVYSIFRKIVLTMLDEKKSIIGENVLRSPYFSQAADFYRKMFAHEISSERYCIYKSYL